MTRIVSLLPSATEIVCALGLEDRLVGVTHECDYPESVRELPKVTRTLIPTEASSAAIDRLVRDHRRADHALYTLDIPALEALRPDVIVTQTLCDVCAVADEEVRAAARALESAPRVIHLEPQRLSEVLASIRQVAVEVGVRERGDAIVAGLASRVEAVVARSARVCNRPRTVLLEWVDPPFSCGHWNPELVEMAGGSERLGRAGEKSRTLRWDDVIDAEPAVVLIACCGFGVERTLQDAALLASVPGWDGLPAVRSGRVYVTDGSQYFSRPGPRLVDSLEVLAHALHPDIHPPPATAPAAVPLAGGVVR